MGCFSTCFGTSNSTRRRRRRSIKPLPSLLHLLQNHQSIEEFNVCQEEQEVKGREEAISYAENPADLSPSTSDEKRENANIRGGKKVTFDLNVKVCEKLALSREEETEEVIIDKEKKERKYNDKASCESQGGSDSSSSSLFSYPPNHRYQNCRDSDDEFDEILSSDESEIDEYTDDDDDYGEEMESGVKDETRGVSQAQSSESLFSLSTDSRKRNLGTGGADTEVNSPTTMKTASQNESNAECNGKKYADSVLNPVENLSQWKVIKARSRLASKDRAKENLNSDQDFSFSVQEAALQKEVAVDTSLSTWLVGSEEGMTPKRSSSSNSSVSVGNASADRKSVSPNRFDDRPILGALTLEEIRLMSAASTPRKSPSRSPDDMPIIGTVGSYWSHTAQTSNSGSSSKSTKSRYRESAEVIWDSTPFETRLEKALEKEGICAELGR